MNTTNFVCFFFSMHIMATFVDFFSYLHLAKQYCWTTLFSSHASIQVCVSGKVKCRVDCFWLNFFCVHKEFLLLFFHECMNEWYDAIINISKNRPRQLFQSSELVVGISRNLFLLWHVVFCLFVHVYNIYKYIQIDCCVCIWMSSS